MYTIFFTNLGYGPRETFRDLDAAVDRARRAGFDAAIFRGSDLVAAWSALGGLRVY